MRRSSPSSTRLERRWIEARGDARTIMACVDTSNLGRSQAELVQALQGKAECPAGFDPERVRLAAEMLALKRLRGVAKAWPVLAGALGTRFEEIFLLFAAATPPPARGGALADGRAFVRSLE